MTVIRSENLCSLLYGFLTCPSILSWPVLFVEGWWEGGIRWSNTAAGLLVNMPSDSSFTLDAYVSLRREDIVFRDPLNTFGGLHNYKLIFSALRFHGRIFFKAIWVDIVRVWQPSDNVITVRWTVRGVPRVPWEAQGRFEGTSEYKLDKEGKIYEHKVDNVLLNSPPKFHAQTVLDLVRVGQTNPTPTFYSEFGAFMLRLSPYLQRFTWVRYYWALICTIALIDKRDLCSDTAIDAS